MKQTQDVKATEKVVVSGKYELIWQDLKRAARNSLIFASPLLILALNGLQQGKTWSEISSLIYGAFLQLLIDLLIKYVNKDKYVVDKEPKG